MHTERFRKLRKDALSTIFDKKAVSAVWRKIVKDQLRSLDIKDLYDHYDFNYNIEDRATAIRNEILNGTYRVSLPLIYRIEKKFGVCRHVVVPQPIDALVLQVLFEIDDVLKQLTNNSFTRWMDDIVIGVDDRKEAIDIISSISDMLKSRGLALNLSKTDIYNSEQAYYHFQIEENKYLDTLDGFDKNDPQYDQKNTELEEKFKHHFKDQAPKYWDKITKRYITAFGKLKSLRLLAEIPDIYLNYPGLRPNLLIYLSNIGYEPV